MILESYYYTQNRMGVISFLCDICSLLICDLCEICRWLISDLRVVCSWLISDLCEVCSWLISDLYDICSLLTSDSCDACSLLISAWWKSWNPSNSWAWFLALEKSSFLRHVNADSIDVCTSATSCLGLSLLDTISSLKQEVAQLKETAVLAKSSTGGAAAPIGKLLLYTV